MAGQIRKFNFKLPDGMMCVECPDSVEGLCWVYILYCSNGSFYVGYSSDVKQRMAMHISGRGARHTQQFKEFDLVYTEGPVRSDVAIKRERQLKKWSRAKKIALITGNLELLKRLSRSKKQ